MKNRWLVFGALSLLISANAQDSQTKNVAPNETEKVAQDSAKSDAKPAESISKEERELNKIYQLLDDLADPFSFGYATGANSSGGSGSDNLIPVNASQLAGTVQIKGIMILENTKVAILQVVGTDRPQVVHEGDSILLPNPKTVRATAGSNNSMAKYLMVTEIKPDSVLVAHHQSPENIITLR